MRLYILRHGKALQQSASGRDADRHLAPRGRAQCEYLAKLFTAPNPPQPLTPRPARILSSPAVRADSTARLIAEALGLKVHHEHALSPDAPLKDALSLIRRLIEDAHPALLIGHNPQLSSLVHHLVGAPGLSTGELSALDLDFHAPAREIGRFRDET